MLAPLRVVLLALPATLLAGCGFRMGHSGGPTPLYESFGDLETWLNTEHPGHRWAGSGASGGGGTGREYHYTSNYEYLTLPEQPGQAPPDRGLVIQGLFDELGRRLDVHGVRQIGTTRSGDPLEGFALTWALSGARGGISVSSAVTKQDRLELFVNVYEVR